jgi:predicted PurR-regulated permease PerM
MGVAQIGIVPLSIPIIIYVFFNVDTLTFLIFLIWSIFVGSVDNILKPILLGRGVDVPMAVIFVGAIGGFLSSGIIGLFVGAVVLVLGFKLCVAWLQAGSADTDPTGAVASVHDSPGQA